MGKAPAYQHYASDFAMDTSSWTCTQVGAFIRLLDYEWVNGGLPENLKELARIAGLDYRNFNNIWNLVLKNKFDLVMSNGIYKNVNPADPHHQTKMFINKTMETERKKQIEYREKQKEYGKLGNLIKRENIKKNRL